MLRFFALIVLLLCSGLVSAQQHDTTSYYKVELYFGLSQNGHRISEKKWQRFVDGYITPRFPDGMTIIDANGQWRNKQQKITKERSKVVVLICKRGAVTDSSLSVIKSNYCKLFEQESVTEVDTQVERVAF